MANDFSPDWSILGNLAADFEAARVKRGRRDALAGLKSGASIEDTSKALLEAGDMEGGLTLAKLADARAMREHNMKRDERDFLFRQQESQRVQSNADRGYGLQQRQFDATIEGGKVPSGWTKGADGVLAPIPNGPADPSYIQRIADAKHKPREFSVNDVTKLSEEGGKFSSLSTFNDTFQDRFAGYKTQTLGNIGMALGRNVPSMVPQDTADAAKWWQGYDRFKNVVRNELFGSALTATEQSAFERADINAAMDPETIMTNLATQHKIMMNGLKRKANALIRSGYDPQAIASAYGVDLADLGVTAQSRRGAAPPPAGGSMMPNGEKIIGGGVVDWRDYFSGKK